VLFISFFKDKHVNDRPRELSCRQAVGTGRDGDFHFPKSSIKRLERQGINLSHLTLHDFSRTHSYSLHNYSLYSCIDFEKILSKGEKKMKTLWRVLAALVLVAAIIGLGVYAYSIGMAQGLAQKAQLSAAGSVQMPWLQYGHPFFGFGFGLLGCLVPLFLLCVVFGSFRALFWHGPMGYRHMHRRHWGWSDENDKDVPPFFAEWHRRAHAAPDDKPASNNPS
jgi:hypothetical protein